MLKILETDHLKAWNISVKHQLCLNQGIYTFKWLFSAVCFQFLLLILKSKTNIFHLTSKFCIWLLPIIFANCSCHHNQWTEVVDIIVYIKPNVIARRSFLYSTTGGHLWSHYHMADQKWPWLSEINHRRLKYPASCSHLSGQAELPAVIQQHYCTTRL